MKSGRKSNDVDGLLDAVLIDEEWQALNCALKSDALAAVGAGRRRRRLRLAIAQVTSAALLLLAAVCWLRSPDPSRRPATGVAGQSAWSGASDVFISEEQMLAMFPPGSCVVAEVNGEKELIFFDAEKANEGFVVDVR